MGSSICCSPLFCKKPSAKDQQGKYFYVAIAMIGFTFIFFIVLDRSAASYLIKDTLMLGACGVCDLVWWSVLGEMLDYGNNPVRIFGIGLSANVLGVFIGNIIGNMKNTSTHQSYDPSVIPLIVVFTISIILPMQNE